VRDLIVLGAGPAGVGAAYRAARAGHDVVVLERSDRPGGAAGSFEVAGVRVDFGSHRLHSRIDAAILSDLVELLGDDLQRRPRNGRIRLAGRWIAFPLKVGDLLRRLPPSFALATARDALTAWARRPRDDSFAEVLRAGLGPALCRTFYWPYARKIWGLDPSDIDGEQARRRVAASSPGKVLRKLIGRDRQPDFFYYPSAGFGSTWDVLADAAAAHGAEFRYGTAARRIIFTDDGVCVETDSGAIEGLRLWSTIPLPALARIAEPPPAEPVLKAAGRLAFRAMVLVYVVVPTERYSAFDAHYLPEAYTPVTRISEPKNYRDGPDPTDRTVLCAEIPCALGGETWSLDDDALACVVLDALEGSGLPRPRIEGVEVRRLPHAYPIYERGYATAFEALDEWATGVPRLLTFGRQGLFAHDNSHHALAMAWAAADALQPDGGFDEAAWGRARARFQTHVVED
jgi:protoporphyrinogen oxidase